MISMSRLIFTIFFVASSFVMFAQNDTEKLNSIHELPTVFEIGEYEYLYADLNEEHPGYLLGICENNMNSAFEKWSHLIYDMETYSKSIDYDMNGVKLWLNVWFKADGTIQNLAYYLKPNSKNMKPAEIKAFLSSFSRQYKMPISSTSNFNHNGSATFPTFSKRHQMVDKN